eukprot:TRINITY_DN8916_c0_g1_i1.p1 TRINITY_DN8916_c0_g1~~TRINITY_DN8916_c0_g1_i1.p1  ORF type:complete len:361 (+),score=62.16 TRINITY_DN8916_c0_g1_i1:93-1085(+)
MDPEVFYATALAVHWALRVALAGLTLWLLWTYGGQPLQLLAVVAGFPVVLLRALGRTAWWLLLLVPRLLLWLARRTAAREPRSPPISPRTALGSPRSPPPPGHPGGLMSPWRMQSRFRSPLRMRCVHYSPPWASPVPPRPAAARLSLLCLEEERGRLSAALHEQDTRLRLASALTEGPAAPAAAVPHTALSAGSGSPPRSPSGEAPVWWGSPLPPPPPPPPPPAASPPPLAASPPGSPRLLPPVRRALSADRRVARPLLAAAAAQSALRRELLSPPPLHPAQLTPPPPPPPVIRVRTAAPPPSFGVAYTRSVRTDLPQPAAAGHAIARRC